MERNDNSNNIGLLAEWCGSIFISIREFEYIRIFISMDTRSLPACACVWIEQCGKIVCGGLYSRWWWWWWRCGVTVILLLDSWQMPASIYDHFECFFPNNILAFRRVLVLAGVICRLSFCCLRSAGLSMSLCPLIAFVDIHSISYEFGTCLPNYGPPHPHTPLPPPPAVIESDILLRIFIFLALANL